ncbi:GSCOCG00005937001-RA-CDS [Cotesia congregata]|uniref:Similar to SV2B: Synaptic vesicle glycoprotein 2B (Homo sapiens) n=1 Tax=Cotesia congregata TaxID=51543 RepID=A0A8J2HKU8_COTCN|nr:GSCOCG00005937001-RA-CDS [Cotesia congregata]CAG5106519.1 Similar to SV2B: Synaptic vesicle glycoprotein 2B (Homo sapiens) [Cotesia congregata]
MVANNFKSISSTQTIFTIENKNTLPKDGVNFETAIELCEYGKFHYSVIIVCGLIFVFGGCQSGINSYIIPAAECDLNLNSHQKGLINTAFLIGGMSSSFLWGISANAYGRKRILVGTLLTDSLLTFLSSLSQSFEVLVVFRAFAGFLIGAPGSLIYNYLGEFHTSKLRVKCMCIIGFCWTSASLLLPGLAWFIIPLKFSFEFAGFIFNSWRLYLGLIGVPTLVLGFILTMYPESPKYLLSRGRKQEALEILREIYAVNTGRNKSDYPVKELKISTDEIDERNKLSIEVTIDDASNLLVIKRLLKEACREIKTLTSTPHVKWALLCWTIYFTNLFGWYGFGIWMPELLNRFENFYKLHPNITTASVSELVSLNQTSTIRKYDCENHSMNEKVFVNTLIINAACSIGNIMCIYLSNHVGRRTIPVTTLIVSGVAGVALYFIRSSTQIIIVSGIFSVAMTAANIVLNSTVVDIFPTHISALALCINSFFGRIGAIVSNIAFGALVDVNCEVLIFLVASIIIVGAMLAFFLPPKDPPRVLET